MATDAAQRMDLEIHRPRAVGDGVVLVHLVTQVDTIQAPREQVDRRGTEWQELTGADLVLQVAVDAVEQHDQFQLFTAALAHGTAQTREIDEQETLRQGEVFLQQAIALESLRHYRQGRLGVIEAARAQGVGR